jgi:hypothetical protein
MTKKMQRLLQLEEAAMFLFSILLCTGLDYAWWIYPALLLLPDLSMLGYLAGPKAGAFFYNLAHHKMTALLIWGMGILLSVPLLQLSGIILFGHSSMDRMFGYGLKYPDSFSNTHLGRIGKIKEQRSSDRNV